jgi:hypothetical protein
MATQYSEEEKKMWVYISNTKISQRRRGWKEQSDNWSTVIAKEIDPANTRVNLKLFKRIQPPANERHLILEAPNAVARRALMDALKATRSHVRIHLHLSP